MYRFMIIVALLMGFAVLAEALCEIDKPSWWSPDYYKCTIIIRIDCPVRKQNYLAGYIQMYDHDDYGYDDYMGGTTFEAYESYYYGVKSREIRVVGRAGDGKFGGSVEPYLKIHHNCGGTYNLTMYKPENDGFYLRYYTYVGILDLELNTISLY